MYNHPEVSKIVLRRAEESFPSRVVLIEDNEGDVCLICFALQEAGFPSVPMVLRDGDAASRYLGDILALPHESLPDLIILDLNLPCVGGLELVNVIRNHSRFDHVPVVVLRSSRSPKDLATVHSFDRCRFHTKPSDLTAFLELAEDLKQFWGSTWEEPARSIAAINSTSGL